MKSSEFIDALTNDIEGNTAGGPSPAFESSSTAKGEGADEGNESSGAAAQSQKTAASVIDEMQEKFRADL